MTDPLTFQPKDMDKKLWMQIPSLIDDFTMESEFLVYSNEETFLNYLDNNLWSATGSVQRKAEEYDVYTDGYAARMRVVFPVA